MEFQFTELMELYAKNKRAYEKRCREIINDYIDSIEDDDRRLRMQQEQWKLDGELRKIKDDLERVNYMAKIFWEKVGEFIEAQQRFTPTEDK